MMKKLFLGAVAASPLVLGGSAWAADRPMYNAPPMATATYDWTGLYFGGHLGSGWEKETFADPVGFNAIVATIIGPIFMSGPGSPNLTSSSFLGGVQAGANYQIGRLVLGSEFDLSWAHLNTSMTGDLIRGPFVIPGTAGTESFSSSTHWIATATTRLGVARDTWLFYGKAGAAWAGNNNSVSEAMTSPGVVAPATLAGSLSDTRVGWTVGTGLEWAFARNWTTKLEYDYANFGTKVENIATGGTSGGFLGAPLPMAANLPVSVSQSVSMVKWGVNYKFDPGFLFW
jgi:outer membrane immunogenic protein